MSRFMSFERWNYLFSFVVSGLLAVYLARVANDPERTTGGPLIVRTLGSWFFSTRWSREPRSRLRLMVVVCTLLSALSLLALIWDPQPRYRR